MVPGGQNNVAQGTDGFAARLCAYALHDGAFVWGDQTGCGALFEVRSTAANQFIARATGGVTFISGVSSNGQITSGVGLAPGSGSWSSLSDRASKDSFAPVDGQALLSALASVPVMSWHYRAQPASVRHLGPTAQDFRAAFGLGGDEQHISTVDADGVALAAVQALYRLLQEKEIQIHQLEQRLERLEQGW